jgi:hypothetical protein
VPVSDRRVRTRVRSIVALLACAGVTALYPAPAAQAQAVPVTCPSTFAVLHDDRIGAMNLAAGHYAITVLDSTLLDCAHASDLFRQFLEDWDGRLPRPWTIDVANQRFVRNAAGTDGFAVALLAGPSGGCDGGRHPAPGATCPSYFHVLHHDHIGSLELPAGEYRITLLTVGRLRCAWAAARFAEFLQDFDGRLPRGWRLDPVTGTFFRGSTHVGFRVKLGVGAPTQPSRAGTHPAGRRCPAAFRVQHNDRIGALRLPAGRYRITRLRPAALSCDEAAQLLTEFLEHPAGDLPEPWVLATSAATFTRGPNSRIGFRVKPARP